MPAIIMLIPYADLLLAVVRRTRAGMSPFAADKKHLQHRLLDIGHSHRASVLIMYMWAALFAGTVVLLSIMRTKLYVLGIVTIGGILVLLLLSMPRLRWWVKPEPGRRSAVRGGPPAAPRPAASPALAGAVAGAGRPVGGAPGPPDRTGYLSPAPVPAARHPGPRPGHWSSTGRCGRRLPRSGQRRPGGRRGAPRGRVCRERVWAGPHGKRARAGFLGGRRGLLSPRAHRERVRARDRVRARERPV